MIPPVNVPTAKTTFVSSRQQTQTMDVNFTKGTMITNAERHNSSDVATAHFSGLKVLTVGSCCYASMSVQPAPGGVEFVEEKILIDVVGNGSIALDDLKSVTDSLAPYVATSPSAA